MTEFQTSDALGDTDRRKFELDLVWPADRKTDVRFLGEKLLCALGSRENAPNLRYWRIDIRFHTNHAPGARRRCCWICCALPN